MRRPSPPPGGSRDRARPRWSSCPQNLSPGFVGPGGAIPIVLFSSDCDPGKVPGGRFKMHHRLRRDCARRTGAKVAEPNEAGSSTAWSTRSRDSAKADGSQAAVTVVIIDPVPEAAPTLVKLEAEISAALVEHHDQLVHRIAVALVEVAVQERAAKTGNRRVAGPKLCSVCRVRLAADARTAWGSETRFVLGEQRQLVDR
jgi:hypothetical protein